MKLKSKDEVKAERLNLAIEQGKASRKGLRGINKKSITYHTEKVNKDNEPRDYIDSEGGEDSGSIGGVGTPTEAQLAVINTYTRSTKTADDLYVINTLSANTLPDRDDDYFDSETIIGFAELPVPYSPNGKAYMVSHDYSNLPSGRIFGTSTVDQGPVKFLTNEVYIPNTAQYKDFIENIDFGVNWAVSVGVMLEAQLCSICLAPQYGSWFFGAVCDTGHFKGALYDPKETRCDDYGYIIEALPEDPKAVKALGVMHGAVDFYELSQCFLGAQFFAALDDDTKTASGAAKKFRTATKSAKLLSPGMPILGLSSAEAEPLPLQHADPRISKALAEFSVERAKDGSMRWTDGDQLMWTYTPGDAVLCLGKAAQDDDENGGEDNHGEERQELELREAADGSTGGAGEGGSAGGESATDGDRSGDVGDGRLDRGERDGNDQPVGSDGDLAADSGADGQLSAPESANSDDTQEGVTMSKAQVLAAARAAKLPAALLAAAAEDEGNGLELLLRSVSNEISELKKSTAQLTSKAAMGEQYLKTIRSDAIAWYVKAKSIGTSEGVNTDTFERLLDACGDNVDLIKALTEEQQNLANAKLPGVRRSSFPTDANERADSLPNRLPEDSQLSGKADRTVSRIHG